MAGLNISGRDSAGAAREPKDMATVESLESRV